MPAGRRRLTSGPPQARSSRGDLNIEAGLPEAEFLGRCEDAGVAGDDHEPVQAAPGAGSDEGAAEGFGQVARVEAGG